MLIRFLKLLVTSLSLISLLMVMGACSDSEEDGIGITLPSVPDDDAPTDPSDPVDDTPIGEIEASGFWVNINTGDQFDAIVSKSTSINDDCFIDVDATGNEFITCYMDVLEGHLYLYNLDIQYNAPPGLCDIVSVTPAWHWNQDIGQGPASVTLDINTSVDPAIVTNCTANHTNLGTVACAAHPELFDITTSGPKCIYDDTATDGVNCCIGDYTLTTNTDSDGDTVIDETSVETKSWGEDYSSCFSPYLNNGWTTFSPGTGLPIGFLQAVPRDPSSANPVGLNDSVSLGSNGSTSQVGFSTWANFYTQDNRHDHTGFYNPTISTLPFFVDPVDDLSGSAVPSGNDAWTFRCLDSAMELKHSIRLYIREWNTLADYLAFETSGGVTYNPDVTGAEGTNCAYDPSSSGNCNDLYDMDDILSNAGGTYNTTPGANDSDRATYFPRIEY